MYIYIGDTLEVDLEYPLASAYAEYDEEPAFTNHALIMLPWEKDDREPFTSCLDFVFYDKVYMYVYVYAFIYMCIYIWMYACVHVFI